MIKKSKKETPQESNDFKSVPIEIVSVGKAPQDSEKKKSNSKKTLDRLKKRQEKKDKKLNKEPFSFKKACQSFFVKFSRDVIRIKWVEKNALGSRFLIVLAFIAFFAIVYGIADIILKLIF